MADFQGGYIGVLGACGKVGRVVCDYLLNNTEYEIKAGYRNTIPCNFDKRIRWQFIDVMNKEKLYAFCNECVIIINCIGTDKNINKSLAVTAEKVNAIYIDAFGTKKLKQEIEEISIDKTGCYILDAGTYPGLTGIAMNYLTKKYPGIKKWEGLVGSFEPISTGAAKDLLFSGQYGFGIENAYWREGKIAVPKMKKLEEKYIDYIKEKKKISLFLPDEMLRIAVENNLELLRWYNILPNLEYVSIMRKAYQKIVRGYEIDEEIRDFKENTQDCKKRWNILSINSCVDDSIHLMIKLDILSTSAYIVTGIMIAILAIEVIQSERHNGIWSAYEILEPKYVYDKLQREGVEIRETQDVYKANEEIGIL